jgi:hypothetical protein
MSQFEAEHGSDDEKFLNLCSLVAAFYFVPEILVPENERAGLSPTEIRPRLDEGRKLLERVLKRGLDNETVKKLLDANSFDESLPSGQDPVDGVLETLILQGAKKTFLAYACGVLSQYYNLRSRYAFGIALLEMFGDFAASKNFLELSNYINALIQMGWVIVYEVRYHTTLTAKPRHDFYSTLVMQRGNGGDGIYITEKAHWPPRPEDEDEFRRCDWPPRPEDEDAFRLSDEVDVETEEL